MKNKITFAKNVPVKKTKKAKGGAAVSDYTAAVRKAIDSYVDKRGFWHRFSRRLDVCGKRLVLICGNAGSGKTSFVTMSGLSYEFVYSGERSANGNETARWFFSEKAVYVDTDSALNEPRQWHDFCVGFKKNKFLRTRAIDGMIIVVDVEELLSMDKATVKRLVAGRRDQADALMSITGYEIPLYFVFTKMDKIMGFGELLADRQIAEMLPVIGSIIDDSDIKRPAEEVFVSYYKKIYANISELCLLKMINIDKIENSRSLCRLSSELLLAEGTIAEYYTEFFKYRGRVMPQFHGFFFTSGNMDNSRILGNVIPNARLKIRESGMDTIGYWVRKIAVNLLMMLICAALIFLLAGGWTSDALYMRKLESELSAIFNDTPTLENQYAALEKLRASYERSRGRFKSPGRLILGTDKIRAKIRDAYVAASGYMMIAPAVKHIEPLLTDQSAKRSGELTAEEHQLLYGLLKTYLLLTSGNSVETEDFTEIEEIFERALKKSFGQQSASLDNRIIADNVRAVIKFASDGLYGDLADKKIVQTARERLAAAPGARNVYAAIMDKLHVRHQTVPVANIVGRNDILRYGHNVSALYTREGWERTVLPEFASAFKDPFKTDWVMGSVKVRIDEEHLFSELISLYSDDLSRRWLDFIRNSHVTLPPDMSSLARDLERLSSSHESETKRMLTVVCSLATQQGMGGANTNTESDAVFNVRMDPFVAAQRIFAPISNFLTGGAFDSYIGNLSVVAEKIKICDAAGGGFTRAFAVRNADPIKIIHDDLNKAYQNMPSAVSAAIKRVLESPIDFTAGALSRKISVEIEDNWNIEVVAYFNDKLKGRYPLNTKGNDAAWSDFEEFFKPQDGILWKFHDRNLSGLMDKTNRGYERRPRRSLSIPLAVSGDILNAYNRAEIIANAFFRSDGSPRGHEIIFHPFVSNNGDAQLWIGERQLNFQSGLPVMVTRTPGSGAEETITLRLITADRAQEELRFGGEWGMIRFFNAARIEKFGSDKYRVNWRMNIRNIYMANIRTSVQTGSQVLFDESVLGGFIVPQKALGDWGR